MMTSTEATSFQKVCKHVRCWLAEVVIKIFRYVGSIVIANGWCVDIAALQLVLRWVDRAILHDPELYPEPEAFKPERFLNEDGTVRDDPLIPLAFGAGRRICPGRHFVDATLFIVTASVLSVFNVTKSKDKNGNEIPVAPPPLDSVQSTISK